MKVKTILVSALAAMTLVSCGALTGTSSSTTATSTAATTTTSDASTAGQSAGAALNKLYAQYKADGKLDMSNTTNLLNMMSLATSCQGLKTNAKTSDYWKSFAQGLVLGSNQLVSTETAASVTNTLAEAISSVDTSSVSSTVSAATEKVQTASTQVSSAASSVSSLATSVSSILSLFSK